MAKVQNRERLLRKLKALPKAARARIGAALDEGADEIVAMQKRLAPKRTGALANSIRKVKGNYAPDNPNVRGFGGAVKGDPDLTVTIVAGDAKAYYAAFVEFGTSPHRIAPKEAEALSINGNVLAPGRAVSHPGATAEPFFYPAYRALKKRVKGRASRAITKAVKEIAGNGGA